MRRLSAFVLAACLGAACGGSGQSSAGGSSDVTTPPTSSSSAIELPCQPSPGTTVRVNLSPDGFDPRDVCVQEGQRLLLVNDSDQPVNFTIAAGGVSVTVDPGSARIIQGLPAPGEYNLDDTIHSSISDPGSITVVQG